MNHSRLSLPLLLFLAVACPLASASDPVAPAAQPTPAAHANPHGVTPVDIDRMFATADTDKDGSISRAEFAAFHAAMHEAHDEDTHHAGCMPMEHATTLEADDAPKADAGK